MLGVVQLAERQIVALKVVGSKPTAHPLPCLVSWWPPYMRRGKHSPALWAWNWFRPGSNPK